MAASRKERADALPFFLYWRHCQTGWAERECRNRGMGMNMVRPPYVEKVHDVAVTETRMLVEGRPVIRRVFSTPVGSVYEDEFREPGIGQWELAHEETLRRTFTENLMTYALGRQLEYYDMPAVRAIVRDSSKQDYLMSAFVQGVVRSQAFRMMQPPPVETSTMSRGLAP